MSCWRGQGRTHAGRRPANEDALVCRDGEGLWAVIDGMGGHDAGDLAATMIRHALENLALGGGIAHRLLAVDAALQSANHAIRHHAAMHLGSKPMGATVVVLLIHDGEAGVLWAGDARLYRHDASRTSAITKDHTPVQALVDAGEIDEEEAMRHPRSHVIYQAIGNGDKLKLEQIRFAVEAGQQFLLTTDGVHSVLRVPEIHQLLAEGASESAILKAALNAGSRDNVTAIKIALG
ncbi:protein phosphatase 2C domain-containing protein [Alcanivorax sp.]|uniref:PP2C family protein-serine/threonine phosphatase n=1 Tax=Alcanivorax sp. TaxID=1872427 RepID=UPI000C611284|nr:protein phosphatase 2C domain-containing protein [Alcanivorax sp.]MBQ24141.1 protein phosphatase [Alcanivorax sp.]|tara:strand:- start:247 stop:951 length:705 start_codon:yes stop_codon:yes gene_type:complete